MREYALIRAGEIVNVVMTAGPIAAVQESYPDFQVRDLYALPADVQKRYRFWDERP
jgi:hypothetical protein